MASIRKRNDKWQVRVQRHGHPSLSKTFTNKADALRWARDAERDIERGHAAGRAEAEGTTLADALERYRREITPTKKGAKPERYRIGVLLRCPLAKLLLSTIRSTDIARYRDSRNAAANTIKNELNTLSAVFEACRLEWGIHIDNPVRGLKRPRQPRGRERRLYHGEEAVLLEACRRSRAWYLSAAVTLALETGMRLGELARLHWDRIDLVKQVARLDDTKNGSTREVPLSSKAVDALQGMPRGYDGRVFPVEVDTIKQSFRSAVARGRQLHVSERRDAGAAQDDLLDDQMLVDLRFHDLRHEAVSRLFERGLSSMEVAAVSGHKTLAMLQRYTHLRAEHLVLRLTSSPT